MIRQSKSVRLASAVLLLVVVIGIGGVFAYRATRHADRTAKFCSASGSACLEYMTIPASFNALPLKIQKVLLDYSAEPVADDGQLYVEVIVYADRSDPGARRGKYFLINANLKDNREFELTDLNKLFSSAKPGYRGSSACDLQNPSRLLNLNETNLRRCLRVFYLSLYVPEFNERTRKLFSDVKVQYSDGTTGPVSFLRPKLTDSDLSKMVSAMERFDKNARSLGGYR
jgi:hypothetical protein